jgi:subtilase family serine protease
MKKALIGSICLVVLCVLTGSNLNFPAIRSVLADGTYLPMHLPLSFYQTGNASPLGVSPQQIRAAYNLPSTGGNGTIAIIDAYDDPYIQTDLNTFSSQFNLSTANFEKHEMSSNIPTGDVYHLDEISLDVEWAHAIAPSAKILLVEATSGIFPDVLSAIDYARNRTDVVAISMSGGWTEQEGPFFATILQRNYYTCTIYQ